MSTTPEILPDGTLIVNQPVALPEIWDILIVGGGPGGTAVAFRAKELGIAALVVDFDDLMKRIRDYSKDKLILPGFGGGDRMKFPLGGELISLLQFSDIDKDDMCVQWKQYYREHNIPAQIGIELLGLQRRPDGIWEAKAYNHNAKSECAYRAKHVVIAIGRGVPRRFDIPGNVDGIAYRLSDPALYIGAPVCVIGGGTSAAEAVIAISNAKIKANDSTLVHWSFRGDKLPKVSKALAEAFFDAQLGNGNIRNHPNSEPMAVLAAEDRKEYLSIRIDRKTMAGRPNETVHLEFLKEFCVACIGEDIPEAFLNTMGIHMATGGPGNKKRMVVTPRLETQQPNVYLVGDILSQAYFETDDFNADPAAFREIKHRGNIKSALRDGVLVAEVIAQKLAGKKEIHVRLADAEEPAGKEEQEIARLTQAVESEGPPAASVEPSRTIQETEAWLVRLLPGNVEENEYPVKRNGVTTIGRKACDINFPDDTLLADKHASISHGPEGYFLRDDGSATGVFLRASEARPLEVFPGNLVRLGKQFLVFRAENGKYSFTHFDHAGRKLNSYPLPEKAIVIGREAPDIILDGKDMTLSRRHLSITVKDKRIFIKDLKSVNGSFLKVKNAAKIGIDDQFRAGQQAFKFVQKQEAARGPAPFGAKPPAPDTAMPTEREEPAPTKPGELVVTFKNRGKSFALRKGQTICDLAEQNGVKITSECHAGICGSDPIRILSGQENLNPLGDEEKGTLEDLCGVKPGECRLACMARPTGAVVVEILEN
jgi:thioredoxin reductase/pSer/pThr/pTyr-binding forkhead associated (FHA) protein/ferredoxin